MSIIIISLLCIILGILVHYGKCYNLIAGYNTLPREQKMKITQEQLTKASRALKNMFLGMGVTWLIGYFTFYYFNLLQYFPYFWFITFTIWCILIIKWSIPINREIRKMLK